MTQDSHYSDHPNLYVSLRPRIESGLTACQVSMLPTRPPGGRGGGSVWAWIVCPQAGVGGWVWIVCPQARVHRPIKLHYCTIIYDEATCTTELAFYVENFFQQFL